MEVRGPKNADEQTLYINQQAVSQGISLKGN